MRLVALVPAHNEQGSIARTLEALQAQDRPADLVVVIPNGCTDETAAIARRFPVMVLELPALAHRKSEALNIAWDRYARDADIVVCLDADTELPPNAFADWEREMQEHPTLGGSSSKFTMQAPDMLSRIQKFEFATWTHTSLRRGTTSVLAGTGCAIRGEALRTVAKRGDREGPWSYESATEDFELTYRIREAGWFCHVSPTVRAYTDSMKTVRALWGQRMKWQVGTIEDLRRIGVNRLTFRDWAQQAMCLFNVFAKALWLAVMVGLLATHTFHFIWIWWALPFVFVGLDAYRASFIPHVDRRDYLLALAFFPQEFFMWMRAGWVVKSWWDVLTGQKKDRWAAQYAAEGG